MLLQHGLREHFGIVCLPGKRRGGRWPSFPTGKGAVMSSHFSSLLVPDARRGEVERVTDIAAASVPGLTAELGEDAPEIANLTAAVGGMRVALGRQQPGHSLVCDRAQLALLIEMARRYATDLSDRMAVATAESLL
jgi:hypothetical protein